MRRAPFPNKEEAHKMCPYNNVLMLLNTVSQNHNETGDKRGRLTDKRKKIIIKKNVRTHHFMKGTRNYYY